MPETAMELINVRKTINNKEIIKGLSFQINKGEVFGLIGPNEAGKTTTIRMMVGLMKLTDGDIRILGKSIKTDFIEAISDVGAIVENPEMYPFMTGMQNLKHYARMIPGITNERILEVIKLVGLEKPIQFKVARYSLGMRQRLGIAQALLNRPAILILDEPTNGLDPSGIREIRQHIRRLATEENVSVIISSHLLSEIELMCDRIGIIKNGELITLENVHEDKEVSEQLRTLEIQVTPVEKAINILKSEYSIDAIVINEKLSFQTQKEKIPIIIKTFVNHDISIYQVNMTSPTLEDKFLDLIGENIID